MRLIGLIILVAACAARAGDVLAPVDASGQLPLVAMYEDRAFSSGFDRGPRQTLAFALFRDGRVVRAEGKQLVESSIDAVEAIRIETRALEIASAMPRREFLYIPPDSGGRVIAVGDPSDRKKLAFYLMLWERGNYPGDTEERKKFLQAFQGLKALIGEIQPLGRDAQATPKINFVKTSVTTRPVVDQETLREWREPTGVRVVINSPAGIDATRPTHLIIFATPNGNSIENTFGALLEPEMDWHYDIQHIAAQTRKLRQIDPSANYVTAVIEPDTRSWPAWRKAHADNGVLIRALVKKIASQVAGSPVKVTLTGHSGGGSFIFGYINGADAIEPDVERICWMDANYGYDDAEKHGDKLLAWLKGDTKRHLIVFAYNDRAATLNGKPFVSETGGTFYRSHKMVERLRKDVELSETARGDFEDFVGMKGQIHFLLHRNPEKKILHTVLVERNGLLEAMTWDSKLHDKWGGEFWGNRAYMDLVRPLGFATPQAAQHATTKRSTTRGAMIGGKFFAETIADLPPKAREAAIVAEVLKGNVPAYQQKFKTIRVKAGSHECAFEVLPDYLAIGSDTDFVRMPMTPSSARQIADALACILPTRKMVNDIYDTADVKLEPRPMTEQREAMRTFVQHNDIIEQQRAGKSLDLLVAGDKKDIVISNRLKEKPNKVAIYGWHKLDGKPIQPLYIGHGDFYVDYSHGVRLVKNACTVDGKTTRVEAVLKDPELSPLLSDEGVMDAGTFYVP